MHNHPSRQRAGLKEIDINRQKENHFPLNQTTYQPQKKPVDHFEDKRAIHIDELNYKIQNLLNTLNLSE